MDYSSIHEGTGSLKRFTDRELPTVPQKKKGIGAVGGFKLPDAHPSPVYQRKKPQMYLQIEDDSIPHPPKPQDGTNSVHPHKDATVYSKHLPDVYSEDKGNKIQNTDESKVYSKKFPGIYTDGDTQSNDYSKHMPSTYKDVKPLNTTSKGSTYSKHLPGTYSDTNDALYQKLPDVSDQSGAEIKINQTYSKNVYPASSKSMQHGLKTSNPMQHGLKTSNLDVKYSKEIELKRRSEGSSDSDKGVDYEGIDKGVDYEGIDEHIQLPPAPPPLPVIIQQKQESRKFRCIMYILGLLAIVMGAATGVAIGYFIPLGSLTGPDCSTESCPGGICDNLLKHFDFNGWESCTGGLDACWEKHCSDLETCEKFLGHFTCSCKQGYSGRYCNSKP